MSPGKLSGVKSAFGISIASASRSSSWPISTDAPEPAGKGEDTDTDSGVDLASAVADVYGEIEAGETPSNLTLRDADLAALFTGLERSGDLADVVDGAHTALDRDGESGSLTRATALRLLVRIGLNEVDPSIIESAKDGKQPHLTKQASEF